MEDRDQLILKILKHIKCLRKDIREMRKSMELAAKIVYTNKDFLNLNFNEKLKYFAEMLYL